MLIDIERAIELDRMQRQWPFLSFACADLTAVLASTARELFPEISRPPYWFFVEFGYIGCIARERGSQERVIYLHLLLNRPETPLYVFRHIFIHELLHV